jgi:hypothetical protein
LVETNLGGNYFGGTIFLVETISVETIFWWKSSSMNSKKGATSNLKDLQIQCSIGLDLYNALNCSKQVSCFTPSAAVNA